MIKRFSFLHRDILRDYLANVTVLFALKRLGYGLHAIAHNSPCDLLRGIASPNSPKIRLPLFERLIAPASIALSSL
ncbi:hypothetical protein QFZ98_004482 [Paraburkholderia youngii]